MHVGVVDCVLDEDDKARCNFSLDIAAFLVLKLANQVLDQVVLHLE